MAAMPGSTHHGRIFIHHLLQGLNPGQHTEPVRG